MIPFDAKSDPLLIKEANEQNEWLDMAKYLEEVDPPPKRKDGVKIPAFRLSMNQCRAIRRK